jgi:hypothetical protein
MYNVNVRLAYAMRYIGKGWKAAQTFCSMMDIPPPPRFESYNRLLLDSIIDVRNMSMRNFVKEEVEMNDGNKMSHESFRAKIPDSYGGVYMAIIPVSYEGVYMVITPVSYEGVKIAIVQVRYEGDHVANIPVRYGGVYIAIKTVSYRGVYVAIISQAWRRRYIHHTSQVWRRFYSHYTLHQ